MKILSKKPFIADGIVLIPLIIATFAYPPISLKNPWIIFCLIFLFGLMYFLDIATFKNGRTKSRRGECILVWSKKEF